MKTKVTLLIFGLGLLLSSAVLGQEPCRDVVYLKTGDIFQGKITAYIPGDTLHIETWNGIRLSFADKRIRKVVQRCTHPTSQVARPRATYTFKERGLYNVTRAGILLAADDQDYSLQHSIGWQFRRWIGAGAGAGMENMSYEDIPTVPTYPVFAELRGYLAARNISPFYSVGAGWAFKGAESPESDTRTWWSTSDSWKGGWMLQAQMGYRLGNHLLVYGGLRFQRKYRNWEQGNGTIGSDVLLHKRFEAGIGLTL